MIQNPGLVTPYKKQLGLMVIFSRPIDMSMVNDG